MKNTIHHVNITDISNQGYGVCRINGLVTFVSGAVDGDELEIKIIKETKSYCVGKIEKMIKPSPYRTKGDCPISKRCGGCVYDNITYAHELELKRNYIKNAFTKIGIDVNVSEVRNTGDYMGYRNKVQYPVGENFTIGFYAAHSHDIIESHVPCPLQCRVFDRIIEFIADFIKRYDLRQVRNIYLRHAKATDEIMVCLVIDTDNIKCERAFINAIISEFPNVKNIQLNINKTGSNVILGEKCLNIYGKDYIEDILCGLKFHISPLSFYQVNHDAAEILYKKVRELADLKEGENVFDLYCGTGTIGLYLAANEKINLTGIEIVNDAVLNAENNMKLNNINNARFICGDADCDEFNNADTLILDPPRKGVLPALIDRIGIVKPKKIIYVSCDPDTLARDIKLLFEVGYIILDNFVQPVDMFPRTGHVETVVLLSHKNS